MKRFGFIYNPNSGHGSTVRLSTLKQGIKNMGGTRLVAAKSKEQIPEMVRRLASSHDVIVACGGDGTIREVAKPLIRTNTPLGIIPMGSGNDLAKSLHIPKNIDHALDILANGKINRIDIGQCNNFIYINTLGFGFDALANRYSYEYHRFGGIFRYILAVFKANIKRNDITVTIKDSSESKQRDVVMITLANGKVEGGSFWIAPDASQNDGKLKLITVDPVSPWILPIYLPFILMRRPHLIPQLNSRDITEITLSFNKTVEIHADGEIMETDSRKFKISVLPKSLNVICPDRS